MTEPTPLEKVLAAVATVTVAPLSAVELQNARVVKTAAVKAPNKWALFTVACAKLIAVGSTTRYSAIFEAVKGVIPNLPEEAAILANTKKTVGATGFYSNHRAYISQQFYQLRLGTPTIGNKRAVVLSWKLQEAKTETAVIAAAPPAATPASPSAIPKA